MNRAELRALRLRLIDGHTLTDEQSLAVVSALEEVAKVAEREFGAPDRLYVREIRCSMESHDECPHAAAANGLRVLMREAGPMPGDM